MSEQAQGCCTQLRGVGERLKARLQQLGIDSIQALLLHLPLRYQDRTRLTPIAALRQGDSVVIEGIVVSNQIVPMRRPVWQCRLQDPSGAITLSFFHFTESQRKQVKLGDRLRCFGEARYYRRHLSIAHPEYRILNDQHATPVENTMTPVYQTTAQVSQHLLRQLMRQALDRLDKENSLPDLIPPEIRDRFDLPDLGEALKLIHQPPPETSISTLTSGAHPAYQRLAFEELLANQLATLQVRALAQAHQAPIMKVDDDREKAFIQALPFRLTQAQCRVSEEIKADLLQAKPMMRLVQGDVGSGKTVVAALAALQAIASGVQVALMAPTEILSEQHYQSFLAWFEPLGITVMFLSGKSSTRDRREILAFLEMGEVPIIIGTHALFQKDVVFQNLGLVIIDEQHRFGVHQRLALTNKTENQHVLPHRLVLTATPIPRTLSMTAYADLDCSVLDELPPGRKPITTVVLANARRDEVIQRIQHVIHKGRQVYWVCTLIEGSENLDAQAAEIAMQSLQGQLPQTRIALVHGRLRVAAKQQVMQAFKAGKLDLLVATTVVEVGVDVPNASLMVIENAERLGLAQLHQLRGRVGRGDHESFCVLLYQQPLSDLAKARLAIMRETQDGFKIAEKDLEIRGPGEVLGTKQTGIARMRIANILRDQALLPRVRQAAKIILDRYPDQVQPLIRRWLREGEQYSKV